jgi:NhaP-type Na+/H+ or K+/H+ antiporter
MTTFDPATFATTLATIGVVIIVAALISGLLERKAFPPVAVFLLLGLAIGPKALGLLDVGMTSPALAIIATLSLTLVLFTDALTIDGIGIHQNLRLTLLVLGPGTLLTTILVGGAAWWLLDLSPPLAAILGAALASTDPVMMRGLLRRPGVPKTARIALGVESGLNDVVVLPVVLVAIVMLGPTPPTPRTFAFVGLNVFLLGPAVGALIGFLAVRLLEFARARSGMRRDYESLYVLGVAFAAFAAAEAMHASGFMAAFAAGIAIVALDVELCDCFHDYGEATSEMFLLFAFVALGTSLIWTGLDAVSGPALAFAAVALFARSAVLWVALRGRVDPESRPYVIWFGPRALSSLLLVLLPVFAGIGEAAQLFPIAALVVLLSVVIHGAMLMKWSDRLGVTPAPAAGDDRSMVRSGELITFDEYRGLVQLHQPLRLVDVRSVTSYTGADLQAAGAVRIPPERPEENAAAFALPKNAWLIAYCA